jgi:hypothetical protein
MKEIEPGKRKRLAGLFQDYQWNYLPNAVLNGYMGKAFADDEGSPRVAVLAFPRLKLYVLGGDAGHPAARAFIAGLSPVAALTFAADDWEDLARECHAGRVILLPRYAFTSESLDIAHLRTFTSQIPYGYRLERIDLELARQLAREKSEFATDHMLNFDSPEDFVARGFGFCLLQGDQIVSAATTFVVCDKGIEIQINTREEHQGRGLATAAAAQMLIHSLQNNLDPGWDAANQISVGLAKKLGYTPQGTYAMLVVVE